MVDNLIRDDTALYGDKGYATDAKRRVAEEPGVLWPANENAKTAPVASLFDVASRASSFDEDWRQHYIRFRPHASVGYRAPAPEVFVPGLAARPPALGGAAPAAALQLAPKPTMN